MTASNEQTMATVTVGHGSTLSVTTGTIDARTPVTTTTPKQVKGGVFASTDYEIIKKALNHYSRLDISDAELKQIANLMHRLNNRT